MKKFLLPLIVLAILFLLAIPQAVFANEHEHGLKSDDDSRANIIPTVTFHVHLVPGQETPPVTGVESSGRIDLRLVNNATALEFRLTVCNIQNVIMAHIHVGAPTVPGPIVLFLFHMPMTPFQSPTGCHLLSSGTLHPSDLIPRPANSINTWSDFVHALLSGNTYANVHTSAHPAGEIRGQLVLKHMIRHDSEETNEEHD